jgi:DNA-binding protein YbaB
MGRSVDDTWIEDAIERYQRVERLLADFDRALAKVDVTVHSPDGLVEVVVAADGTIREVTISDSAQGRPARELSRAVQAAVAAAADAARWARAKLHSDMFSDYRDLGVDRGAGGASQRRGNP